MLHGGERMKQSRTCIGREWLRQPVMHAKAKELPKKETVLGEAAGELPRAEEVPGRLHHLLVPAAERRALEDSQVRGECEHFIRNGLQHHLRKGGQLWHWPCRH